MVIDSFIDSETREHVFDIKSFHKSVEVRISARPKMARNRNPHIIEIFLRSSGIGMLISELRVVLSEAEFRNFDPMPMVEYIIPEWESRLYTKAGSLRKLKPKPIRDTYESISQKFSNRIQRDVSQLGDI